LESNIGKTNDKSLFQKIYFLCIFKVFENEPDILIAALQELGLPKEIKSFVIDNLTKYPYVLNHDLSNASFSSIFKLKMDAPKNHFLPTLCAVEKFI
jgi:hypothetical protein